MRSLTLLLHYVLFVSTTKVIRLVQAQSGTDVVCTDNAASDTNGPFRVCYRTTIDTIEGVVNLYPNGTRTQPDDVYSYQYEIFSAQVNSNEPIVTISMERSYNVMIDDGTTYSCDYVAINDSVCNSCTYCTTTNTNDVTFTADCTNIPNGRKVTTCESSADLFFPLTRDAITTSESSPTSTTVTIPTPSPTSTSTTVLPTSLSPTVTTEETEMPSLAPMIFNESSLTTPSPSPSSSDIVTDSPISSSGTITLSPVVTPFASTFTLSPIVSVVDDDDSMTLAPIPFGSGGGTGPIIIPVSVRPPPPRSMPPYSETTTGVVIRPCKTFDKTFYTAPGQVPTETHKVCINPQTASASTGGIFIGNDTAPSTPEIHKYIYNSTIYYFDGNKLYQPIIITMERTGEVDSFGDRTQCNYLSMNGQQCTSCTYCGNEAYTADCTNLQFGIKTTICESSSPVVFPFVTNIFSLY